MLRAVIQRKGVEQGGTRNKLTAPRARIGIDTGVLRLGALVATYRYLWNAS